MKHSVESHGRELKRLYCLHLIQPQPRKRKFIPNKNNNKLNDYIRWTHRETECEQIAVLDDSEIHWDISIGQLHVHLCRFTDGLVENNNTGAISSDETKRGWRSAGLH